MAARRLRFVAFVARLALLLLLAVLLLTALLPFLARLHPLLDFLCGFRVQALFYGVAVCLFAASLRWRRRLLLPVALVLTAVPAVEVVSLVFPDRRRANDYASRPFRLLAFNVLHGNKQVAEVRDFVRQENPDLAVFFEADRHWPSSLAPLQKEYPYRLPLGQHQCQIYCKHPLSLQQVRTVGVNRGDVILTVNHPAGPITVVASHAYPQLHYGVPGYRHRNQQLHEHIGSGLSDVPRPLVVIGDLNVSPWSPHFRKMLADSGLHDGRRGTWPLPTQSRHEPAFLFGIPIDHCLVSSEVRVEGFRLGPRLGSDHRPLIVDVAF